MGSLRYMPPEVLNDEATSINPEIDIWAMGVILFRMVKIFISIIKLFGVLPFDGKDVIELA